MYVSLNKTFDPQIFFQNFMNHEQPLMIDNMPNL